MPPRTMLPPNLTRHYYEAKRQALAAQGLATAPWHQLTEQRRAELEDQMRVFRHAVRLAEQEQDLIAALNAEPAPQAAAAEEIPAAEEATTGPDGCGCCTCAKRAEFVKLLKEAYEPLGMTVREPIVSAAGGFSANVVALDTRRWGVPLTQEEIGSLAAATDSAFRKMKLMTAGIDFGVLEHAMGKEPLTFGPPLTASETERLEKTIAGMLRDWEADGRPLDVVSSPTAITFDSKPLDMEALERELLEMYGSPEDALRRELRAKRWFSSVVPPMGVTDFRV